MGPFALMDLVGQDVNEAVTRSVWTAFGYDPRFAPSLLQRAIVDFAADQSFASDEVA